MVSSKEGSFAPGSEGPIEVHGATNSVDSLDSAGKDAFWKAEQMGQLPLRKKMECLVLIALL